ncbi:YHS domain-containing protein [Weeksella sp. HMSC059D05]|uniref:YHS domain-containing protein n=2 Tax=Weeksellaceae TaxID=2762318 RepID=F0NYG8_WEEVC|nr:YHS domain-containing protein [Weeksella virosa]ADX67088.1 YHS domain-containing protein [Weeksella virosa DSM 16922]OFM83469.1 YHS domain-containing protein [Weeksella sp. HMSC059D05]SUP53358.1 Uncharacterized protein conserved in bacteria [Weeksella virosa]VEH63176.1 Uncharacterized protein conserved in bacteria [Weeksella virosa]
MMKKIITLNVICVFMLVSCQKKTEPEVKVAHEMPASQRIDVAVDNEIDPVCGMKTSEHLTDTAHYEGKVYGFCSAMCKEKFLEEPTKYIHE